MALETRSSEECAPVDDTEQLVQLARVPSHSDILASRRPVVMPTRGGMKDFRVDGSERQSTKLELFHEASRVLFAEEHVVNKKSLSIAEWKTDKGFAEVKIAKGSWWRWMGRSVFGQLTVWPEEALFLLETGHLELYHGGLPLSIQQGFYLLTQGTLTSIEYQVYSMLVRAGLIVYRSRKRDGVAHVSVGNYTTHNIQTSPAETESNQSIFTSSRVEPASTDILTTKRDTGLQCQDVHKGQAASKRGRKESNETTPIPAKKRRLGCSGRGGLTDSLLVTAARGALLLLAADAAQGDTKARNSLQQLMERRLDTRQDVSVVSPMDATSTDAILNKLRIFPNQVSGDVPLSLKSRFSVSFDVYKYRSQFRKTELGPPDYYVVIAKSSEPPPFLSEINLMSKAANGVPVKWAMIDSGNVSFYDFMDLQLPTVVSKG